MLLCPNAESLKSEDPAVVADSVVVTLSLDKSEYALNDRVNLSLDVTNHGDTVATFSFSSGQRYDFAILDVSQREVWRWSADMAFIQIVGQQRISPGEQLIFGESAPPLPAGSYTALGQWTALEGPLEARASFTVR